MRHTVVVSEGFWWWERPSRSGLRGSRRRRRRTASRVRERRLAGSHRVLRGNRLLATAAPLGCPAGRWLRGGGPPGMYVTKFSRQSHGSVCNRRLSVARRRRRRRRWRASSYHAVFFFPPPSNVADNSKINASPRQNSAVSTVSCARVVGDNNLVI